MAISHKPTYGPVTSRLPVIRPEEEFAAEPWRRPPLHYRVESTETFTLKQGNSSSM
jgi:hypothetical protein